MTRKKLVYFGGAEERKWKPLEAWWSRAGREVWSGDWDWDMQ